MNNVCSWVQAFQQLHCSLCNPCFTKYHVFRSVIFSLAHRNRLHSCALFCVPVTWDSISCLLQTKTTKRHTSRSIPGGGLDRNHRGRPRVSPCEQLGNTQNQVVHVLRSRRVQQRSSQICASQLSIPNQTENGSTNTNTHESVSQQFAHNRFAVS